MAHKDMYGRRTYSVKGWMRLSRRAASPAKRSSVSTAPPPYAS